MATRFTCSCGMAFSVETVRPGRPIVCPACGAVHNRDAGRAEPARRDESAPPADPGRPTVRCPDCGALNSADSAICGLCGARIGLDALLVTGSDSAVAATAAPLETALVGEEPTRKPIRYEGALRVPLMRLVLKMLIRPHREMESLVSFLSYRDILWKLLALFLLGVAGLWAAGSRYPGLPIVSGFTFGARVPLRASWIVWLGMAFTAAAFITAGLTCLTALAGLVTGHGWHLSALSLAFLFIVALVNAGHLLLLPVGLLGETAVTIAAWGLLAWGAMLTLFVVNKVLDCDPVLSLIMALVICAATVHFYNRVYRLTERILPGQERVQARYDGRG